MAIIIMCVCVCACVCPARVATPIFGGLLPHAVLTPAAALYFPAAQSVQTEAPAPEYLPATQMPQSVALVFASEPENLPAAQSVQTEAAVEEYFPVAQLMQAAELVCAVDPEYVPAPQGVHVSTLVCAVDPEYVPAGQRVQTEAPANEYVPASQSVQEVVPELVTENFPAKNHRTITMRESCKCCADAWASGRETCCAGRTSLRVTTPRTSLSCCAVRL